MFGFNLAPFETRNYLVIVVEPRVIYDRILNKKNDFEIPALFMFERGKSRARKFKAMLNYTIVFFFCFEFPALEFPRSNIKKAGISKLFFSFSTLSHITLIISDGSGVFINRKPEFRVVICLFIFYFFSEIPIAIFKVIYDRVLNEKNYFEIPASLCLNEESQEW